MRLNSFLRLFLIAVVFFSVTNAGVFAQIPATEDILVRVTPENPGANQGVYASIESYFTDLNRANIAWILNGTTAKSGVGGKTFIFNTGKLGSTSVIDIVVVTEEGVTINKRLSIRPSEVDIVWESDSYTPPFYRGKALHANKNNLRITAIPNMINSEGTKLNPKNLVYTWKKDGVVLGNSSGFGRQTFSFASSVIGRPITLEVDVSSIDQSIRATQSVVIEETRPQVLLYEDHPLYGIQYNKALKGEFALKSQEVTVAGIPYFFGVSRKDNPALSYTWSMNGSVLKNIDNKDYAIFRQTEGVTGVSNISVSVQHRDKIIQSANNNLSLMFSENIGDAGVPSF